MCVVLFLVHQCIQGEFCSVAPHNQPKRVVSTASVRHSRLRWLGVNLQHCFSGVLGGLSALD